MTATTVTATAHAAWTAARGSRKTPFAVGDEVVYGFGGYDTDGTVVAIEERRTCIPISGNAMCAPMTIDTTEVVAVIRIKGGHGGEAGDVKDVNVSAIHHSFGPAS
jgi:small-conductance mechanosensitive channel